MRVDAGISYLYATRPPQTTTIDRSVAAPSVAALNVGQADSVKQADFSNMTRQEMRGWLNAKLRSGEMSLDDSRPFMAMTMKIPVAGGAGGELPVTSDGTRYDFMQQVRDGIQGALSRNDETTLKMLESAMSIMQKSQGQAIGVDVRV